MSTSRLAALLFGGALLSAPALAQAQQASPVHRQLQPTAKAEPAKTAFRAALYESQNVRPDRARAQIAAAVQADPDFGLAHVYQAFLATGLTAAERESRISALLGSMGTASPAEIMLAVYWREVAAGRGGTAAPILRAAADLVPDDAEIAYGWLNSQQAGRSAAEAAEALREFVTRFPTHAAAWNQLAYTRWRAGDGNGALQAVEQYERHAPDHPNAHDSHADILMLLRRPADAMPHVRRAMELDPAYVGAHVKLGAIQLMLSDVKTARDHFETALRGATTDAARIDVMHWNATAQVQERNARGAVAELMRIADLARTANMPAALALAYDRAAVIDAYIGNRRAVAAHLAAARAAAANDNQRTTVEAHAALALSRTGNAEEARAAAQRFAAAAPTSTFRPVLDAILALDTRDAAAAQAAVDRLEGRDPLAQVLRAELMARNGRTAEARALRDEVLASSLKVDGNNSVEFLNVIARLRAMAL